MMISRIAELMCVLYVLALIGAVPLKQGLKDNMERKIDHVVILMLENRAFDHMLGSMALTNREVDGCTPDLEECWNPEDPTVADSPRHYVNWNAVYEQSDPGHSIHDTTKEIYGQYSDDNTIPPAPFDQPTMKGFIADYVSKNGGDQEYGNRIMEQFSAEHVPAITTLANEFATFDGWFASVPGPTMVNRAYAMSATSNGMGVNNSTEIAIGMPQKTMFKQMLDMGYDYKVYFSDGPTAGMFKDVRRMEPQKRLRGLRQFYRDAKQGKLPELTWLEPAYFDLEQHPATDQHPDHDVSAGDDLIRSAYNALRASPKWESTAFIVTYDEHGGFFDHVAPPSENVPNPDGKNSTDDPFQFNRMGVRLPTIVVSPYVPKGLVVHAEAQGQGQYEHSSLVSTVVHKLFQPRDGRPEQEYLTKRDAWAATFENVFSLEQPRTDTPVEIPPVPSHRKLYPHTLPKLDGRRPLTDLQLEILAICAGFDNQALSKDTFAGWTEAQGSAFCMKHMGMKLEDAF